MLSVAKHVFVPDRKTEIITQHWIIVCKLSVWYYVCTSWLLDHMDTSLAPRALSLPHPHHFLCERGRDFMEAVCLTWPGNNFVTI